MGYLDQYHIKVFLVDASVITAFRNSALSLSLSLSHLRLLPAFLRNHEELCDAVLLHRHGKRNAVLLNQHFRSPWPPLPPSTVNHVETLLARLISFPITPRH